MRFTLIITAALIVTPATLATQATAAGMQAAQATDISAAKKKAKKVPAKPKEEYLKAAPGTGPSGPKN